MAQSPPEPAAPPPADAAALAAARRRRDLLTRSLLTPTMLAVVGLCYWLDVTRTGGRLSAALLGLLGVAGVHEFVRMLRGAGFPVAATSLLLGTATLSSSAFLFGWRVVDRELYPLIVVTFSLLFPIALRSLTRRRMSAGLEEQGATLLGFISIAWPIYLAQGLVIRHPPSALYVVLVCKAGDIAGYLVGSFLGRHKLIPHISPGKTVEGALGSMAGSVATALALRPVLLAPTVDLTLTVAVGVGIMLNLTTQIGDLIESLLKRRCAVKDSGRFLPAHGGVLDLIDSLLFSFPAFLLVVTCLT